MSEIQTKLEAIYHQGYCLWAGAGLTRHVSALRNPSASWVELVTNLEQDARVAATTDALDVRLGRCWRKLGFVRFQRAIRRQIHLRLAESILCWSEDNPGLVPDQVREIGTLARGANVVVNFNVELGTSRLLGECVGSYSIKVYESPIMIRLIGPDLWSGFGGAGPPRVSILHPHGALETGGLCVLTNEDYSDMNGTLALQLAAHAGFRENIVIVGMSLADEYLRAQLLGFRQQIQDVSWLRAADERLDATVAGWVRRANVQIVEAPSWPDVWREIDAAVSGSRRVPERTLQRAWLAAIDWACENDSSANPCEHDVPDGLLTAARAVQSGSTRSGRENPRWERTGKPMRDALNAK